ncbi:MAG: HupE/UreJ family protein [bacterium]
MRRIGVAAFLFCCMVSSFAVFTDEFRPALLEVTEFQPGSYTVKWKVPLQAGQPLGIAPKFPPQFSRLGPVSRRNFQGSVIEESTWTAAAGSLIGGVIEIDGLTAIPVDVILQIDLVDGAEHSAILRSATPTYTVPERTTKWGVAGSYWKIGTIHILEGFDHLLFVLALVWIVPNLWMLFKTITAFTVAHSISLALATLGIVHMPAAPTEAVIALSILFLAVEIVHSREGRVTLTEQYPWLVALAFGLFHGLGFAGALAEVGLPQQEIPLALLMFNVGVETGQILFVGVVLLLLAGHARLPVKWPGGSWRLMPYTIGGIAAFWTLQRIDAFVQG